MATFQDYLDLLISGVRVRNPSMDTSPGSPVRTLLDPTAEMAAQADIGESRINDWSIDNKSGTELDSFISIFGMTRLPARHAVGTVTLTFASNTTRDYIIPEGTNLYSKRGNRKFTYKTTTAIGIPRYSSYATLPVIAEFPGSAYNAREGEIRTLDYILEQLVLTINQKPVRGGKNAESDEDFKNRFRADLFRNRLGSEAWYRSLASRHNAVSSLQLITPSQEVEEYLIIREKKAQCQEDSIKFTYPNSFGVYQNRTNLWLEEGKDYIVIVDNDTPSPPRIEFISNATKEEDNVMIRYRYCSLKSRNNPKTNVLNYIDMYVLGSSPSPVIDYSYWPSNNLVGTGAIIKETHPTGSNGRPYFIFVRQPVIEVPDEMKVGGKSYYVNKDYKLVKDEGPNANSTKAKDYLEWITSLPTSDRNPGFNVNYFHESVIKDIQDVVNAPDMHSAVDDVLIHAANRIDFDVNVYIEWSRGIRDEEQVKNAVEEFFSSTKMGSKIRIGGLIRTISRLSSVNSVFLATPGISSDSIIRGRTSWNFDVPIPDGAVPSLRNLNITTTASNIFE